MSLYWIKKRDYMIQHINNNLSKTRIIKYNKMIIISRDLVNISKRLIVKDIKQYLIIINLVIIQVEIIHIHSQLNLLKQHLRI